MMAADHTDRARSELPRAARLVARLIPAGDRENVFSPGGFAPPDPPTRSRLQDLPCLARVVSRLIPSGDRESILGDLLEDAECRSLGGARRDWWLVGECGSIAAGLSITRARAWLVLPPVRELAAGLALDGHRAFRGGHPIAAVARAVVFCGSIATIVLGVELLVGSLLSAAGL